MDFLFIDLGDGFIFSVSNRFIRTFSYFCLFPIFLLSRLQIFPSPPPILSFFLDLVYCVLSIFYGNFQVCVPHNDLADCLPPPFSTTISLFLFPILKMVKLDGFNFFSGTLNKAVMSAPAAANDYDARGIRKMSQKPEMF